MRIGLRITHRAVRRQPSVSSGGTHGDAGVRQHQTGLVVDQPAGEIERWGGAVVAVVALVSAPCVPLLEALGAQVEGPYEGGRRLAPSYRC